MRCVRLNWPRQDPYRAQDRHADAISGIGKREVPAHPPGVVVSSFQVADIWDYRPAVGFQQAGSSDAAALARDG
jgi:hypothetical protein